MTRGATIGKSLSTVIVWVMMFPALCLAHGARHTVFKGGTGVEATYDDGSPMAFCDVSVFSPGDPVSEYQTGITDPRGRLAFVPDTNGVWKVTVDDGMGHMAIAEVLVGLEGIEPADSRAGMDRPTGAIVGVSMIFGLFGIYCLLRQRLVRARLGTGCGGGESGCTLPKG